MLMQLKLPDNYRLNDYGDLEKYCPRCPPDECWWPADSEFFNKGGNEHNKIANLQTYCRACEVDYKMEHYPGRFSGRKIKQCHDPHANLLFGSYEIEYPALWQQGGSYLKIKYLRELF